MVHLYFTPAEMWNRLQSVRQLEQTEVCSTSPLFPGVTHCRNERLLHVKNGSATPIRAEPNSTADQWAIFAVLPRFVEEISSKPDFVHSEIGAARRSQNGQGRVMTSENGADFVLFVE